MHLFVTNEVYIIQKINKRKNSDVLNEYLKLRYSSSKKKIYETTMKSVSILSIGVCMYFFYLGFHDVVPVLFMRLCTVTLLLLLNVLSLVLFNKENKKLERLYKGFTLEKQKEMAKILVEELEKYNLRMKLPYSDEME